MTVSDPSGRSASLAGMLYMTVGGLLLTTQDAISKWLSADWHAGEIMAYRGLFMLVPIGIAMAWQRDASFLRPKRPKAVGVRALVTMMTSALVVLSVMVMPLADALAVIFLSPLLVTAGSALFLKEPVGWRRWGAVIAGFIGVVMIASPGSGALSLVVAVPLAAAACAASRDIITRRIGMADTTLCVLFWSVFLTMLGGLVTLPFGTHWPQPVDWALFAAAGLLGGASHFLTTRAFQIAAANVMAPFKYLSLVWGAMFGYLLWQDVPGPMKVAGAALMVASGLYVAHRERVALRAARLSRSAAIG